MAAKAAEEALADSGLKAEEIDLILVATSSSETVFPNTSCEVQKAIGAVLHSIRQRMAGFSSCHLSARSWRPGHYRERLVEADFSRSPQKCK